MEGFFNLIVLLLVISSVLSKLAKKRAGGSVFETIRKAVEEQDKASANGSGKSRAPGARLPAQTDKPASSSGRKRRAMQAKPVDDAPVKERRFESLENEPHSALVEDGYDPLPQTHPGQWHVKGEQLVNAVIWSEILGKPKALRSGGKR